MMRTILFLLSALLLAPFARAAAKVGLLLKGDTPFWSAVEDGCRDVAKKTGTELVVRKPKSESDIAGQIKLLDELAAQNLQALIVAPCNATALSAPVAAVAAKGVKIVAIDSPLDVDMPAYIATNHTNAGMAAGKLLATLVGDHDEVSILRHNRTGGATLLRESSGYSALCAVHPKIVVHRDVYSGVVTGEELQQAKALLQKYPATKGILASSTPGSMAMLQALEESGRAGSIKFVGFGFNLNPTVAAAIERGTMHGWIAQLPGDIGGRGLNAALALLDRRPVAEVTYCDFLVITKENLHDPRVQALLPATK